MLMIPRIPYRIAFHPRFCTREFYPIQTRLRLPPHLLNVAGVDVKPNPSWLRLHQPLLVLVRVPCRIQRLDSVENWTFSFCIKFIVPFSYRLKCIWGILAVLLVVTS